MFAQSQQFSVISVLLFLFFTALFYIQPIFHTSSLLFSFISFAILALMLPGKFTAGSAVVALLFACMFYIIVGVKNLILIRRREWYYLLFLSLNYLALFLFFSADSGTSFWLKSLLFFIFSAGIGREFLRFQEIGVTKIHKVSVFVVALIEIEFLWVVSMLPFSPAYCASFMTALIFSFAEITQRYMRGTLSAQFIRLSVSILALLMFVMFFFSNWKL